MTKREIERATLEGITARQNGAKAEANPYARKPALRLQADAWQAGWNEADRRMRR